MGRGSAVADVPRQFDSCTGRHVPSWNFCHVQAAPSRASRLPSNLEKASSAFSRREKAKPMSAVIGNTITTPRIVLTALVSFWNSKK